MSMDGKIADELDATLRLLWFPAKAKKRGPKPSHSLEEVLDAAIGIADRDGLSAVSMQRLAQELGFTKMAIYRYVPSRSALIALMTDHAIGRPPATFNAETWRQRMEKWASAVLFTFLCHPWGIEATTGQRIPGPCEIAWVEAGLVILADIGLDSASRLDVLAVITGHIRFTALQARGTGATIGLEAESNARMAHALGGRELEFPQFSTALLQTAAKRIKDDAMDFGLRCILDGIERQIGAI
ncbi:MAG: TetR/AcrR family transcriptional regulator [Sphingomonas sp.]